MRGRCPLGLGLDLTPLGVLGPEVRECGPPARKGWVAAKRCGAITFACVPIRFLLTRIESRMTLRRLKIHVRTFVRNMRSVYWNTFKVGTEGKRAGESQRTSAAREATL